MATPSLRQLAHEYHHARTTAPSAFLLFCIGFLGLVGLTTSRPCPSCFQRQKRIIISSHANIGRPNTRRCPVPIKSALNPTCRWQRKNILCQFPMLSQTSVGPCADVIRSQNQAVGLAHSKHVKLHATAWSGPFRKKSRLSSAAYVAWPHRVYVRMSKECSESCLDVLTHVFCVRTC